MPKRKTIAPLCGWCGRALRRRDATFCGKACRQSAAKRLELATRAREALPPPLGRRGETEG